MKERRIPSRPWNPPPEWRRVGDLATLLEPASATSLLRSAGLSVHGVQPDYLRLKPYEAALVGFTAEVRRPDGVSERLPGYARTFSSPERAMTSVAKWARKRSSATPAGPGVALAPGGATAVFLFPNDGELSGLATVAELGRCRRLLAELPGLGGWRVQGGRSTLVGVRYKPERRFIARLRLGLADDRSGSRARVDAHLRWFQDGRGADVHAVATALRAAGVPVPRPLGTAAGGRLVVEESVPGVDGVQALSDGLLDPDAVAFALTRMHAVAPGTAVRRKAGAAAQLQAALAALGTMAVAEPALAGDACRLATSLRSTPATTDDAGLVHGDLHLHQLVATRRGVTLVDLERVAVGPPAVDLAALLAHLAELRWRDPVLAGTVEETASALRQAWRRRHPFTDDAFGRYLACALIDRALLAFRRLEPAWQDLADHLLQEAHDTLGAPRWQVVHPRPHGSWSAVTRDGDGTAHAALEPGRWEPQSPGHDRALPGLAALLPQGELRAYRPGRRAVVRLYADGSFAKALRPRRTGDHVARLRAVHALVTPTAPRIPAVLAVDEADGIVVLEPLPGVALHDALIGGDASHRRSAIAEAGSVLQRFHALHPAAHPAALDLPAGVEGGTPADWLTVVDAVHPNLRGSYEEVAQRYAGRPEPAGFGLVHGDLHDRNVLLDADRGGLIDLDAVGLGDPAIDVGNLAAHILLRALQRRDSAELGGDEAAGLLAMFPASRANATFWAGRTLFRLSCLYRFRHRWAHLSSLLLGEARRWAEKAHDERQALPAGQPPTSAGAIHNGTSGS